MQQYLDYLRDISERGDFKGDRTGTGTWSVFGRQMRFDLREGFPIVTTKKLHMKSVIHELLWFLKGETNIKSLQENGVTIWDEWADENGDLGPVYGSQWRAWPGGMVGFKSAEPVGLSEGGDKMNFIAEPEFEKIDQIQKLIDTLRTNPDSRRIIVSAWNVAEVDKMKLPPCHAFFQFYSTQMSVRDRYYLLKPYEQNELDIQTTDTTPTQAEMHAMIDRYNVPRRYLDCQLYQRSH